MEIVIILGLVPIGLLAIGFLLIQKLSDGQKELPDEQKGTFFIDSRDGKKYRTVKIGDRVWMAENLNYEAAGSKSYNNDPAIAKKYGRLYDLETAKKACPEGWHLPSYAEWYALKNHVDYDTSGTKLKAKYGWKNVLTGEPGGNGTDEYGFSALPGGCYERKFTNIGYAGNWWSSSGEYWDMWGNNKTVDSGKCSEFNLYSVRCVQDEAKAQQISGEKI